MSFTSIAFLLFLPIVFALYWIVGGVKGSGDSCDSARVGAQNLLVVMASYVFYGWWSWRFLLLITLTSVWAYVSGILMERFRSVRLAKVILGVALIVNLGILGIFKYYDFFIENLTAFLTLCGFQVHLLSLRLILPVGISFYTFQALSYVIDVYRGSIKPTRDLIAFLAFVSFFPQLVAGPIERATNLLPQFLCARRFEYAQAADGCRQMLWGFFKKMVIADNCAVLANHIFNAPHQPEGLQVVVGALAFTLQIYGDFSGYSDIAIGCSRLFGVKLMQNFAFPYFSCDVAEFWRRWHISLNTWFRDYLYIPLGGSRCGTLKKIRNVYVIFLVSGLWHGANWTFVCWGAFHATCFLPLMLRGRRPNDVGKSECSEWIFANARRLLCWCFTLSLVVLGWLIFRAPDITTCYHWLLSALSQPYFSSIISRGLNIMGVPWALVVLGFSVEFYNRRCPHGLARLPLPKQWAGSRACRTIFYALLTLTLVIYRGGQSDFIYFQF